MVAAIKNLAQATRTADDNVSVPSRKVSGLNRVLFNGSYIKRLQHTHTVFDHPTILLSVCLFPSSYRLQGAINYPLSLVILSRHSSVFGSYDVTRVSPSSPCKHRRKCHFLPSGSTRSRPEGFGVVCPPAFFYFLIIKHTYNLIVSNSCQSIPRALLFQTGLFLLAESVYFRTCAQKYVSGVDNP